VGLATRISPLQVDLDRGVGGNGAEPEVQVGAPLPGMTVAAVYLGHTLTSIREMNGRGGAYRSSASGFSARATRVYFGSGWLFRVEG
jgi:hypothetical protein